MSAPQSNFNHLTLKYYWKKAHKYPKLLTLGKTTLVVAHRLSTLREMDRIIVFDQGQIVEDGPHKELIKQNGKYAELWAHQSGGFIN